MYIKYIYSQTRLGKKNIICELPHKIKLCYYFVGLYWRKIAQSWIFTNIYFTLTQYV